MSRLLCLFIALTTLWSSAQATCLPPKPEPAAQTRAFFDMLRTSATTNPKLEQGFTRFARGQGKGIQSFVAEQLATRPSSNAPVYYPFGGPDLLFAWSFFPQATQVVLTGLEPIGSVPDVVALEPEQIAEGLTALHGSVQPILQRGFFVTATMQKRFKETGFDSTLAVILLFAQQAGATLEAIAFVNLDAKGNACAADPTDAHGVQIALLRDGIARTVWYIRQDLSNDGLSLAPGYAAFVHTLGRHQTLIKSASYLMHSGNFSAVRALILDSAQRIVQDDSGIPYRAFDQRWEIALFGHYPGAADSFPGMGQSDLASAFARAPTPPLPFWYGYRHGAADSHLLLAERRLPQRPD